MYQLNFKYMRKYPLNFSPFYSTPLNMIWLNYCHLDCNDDGGAVDDDDDDEEDYDNVYPN